MKKLLYIAPILIDNKKADGVAKKVQNHYYVFSQKYECWLVSYGTRGIVVKHRDSETLLPFGNRHRRFELYSQVLILVENEKFDYVYIRYPKSEPSFISLLKAIKKHGLKVVVEIPTFPYDGDHSFRNVRLTAVSITDRLCRRQLKKYIDRIVTFSDDDEIFGIQTIKTINGFRFDNVGIVNALSKKNGIDLIAVAMLADCHGYDRIIMGMEKYYSDGGKEEIRFHIVGTGLDAHKYQDLIEKCTHLDGRAVMHGFKTGGELEKLYDISDIAVNSLAIHRLGLKTESTLKTKEYAAKGLPMLSSYFVDAFSKEDHDKYVLLLKSNDEAIEMEKVIDFYHKVYDGKERSSVAADIREVAKKVCDMSITLRPIEAYFDQNS